jgi:hypothetical protein
VAFERAAETLVGRRRIGMCQPPARFGPLPQFRHQPFAMQSQAANSKTEKFCNDAIGHVMFSHDWG